MTENELCPRASDTRSISFLHCLHFSVSLTSATRFSSQKNTEKCQETSQEQRLSKNSLQMKAAHMSKVVRYSDARTGGKTTHIVNASQLETPIKIYKYI